MGNPEGAKNKGPGFTLEILNSGWKVTTEVLSAVFQMINWYERGNFLGWSDF